MSTRPTLRQAPVVPHSRILGLGVHRPDVIVQNADVIEAIDSSDEWIRQRTGIVTRHRAAADVSVVDMSVDATEKALAAAGLTGEDVDTVLLATVTHPYATPSAAAKVADRIGAIPAAAYDISAACAGYCYGIAQADALVRAGTSKHVVVVGVEKLSDFIDPTDRSISFLLGDGAGAVVIGPSETPGIGPTVWGSDGQWDAVSMNGSLLDLRDGTGSWPTIRQEGPTVFRWASYQMAPVALRAIEAAGVTPDDIEAFIPHQANVRIINEMAKKIGLPESVAIARDIVDAGNTSAASIPLATERLVRDGQVGSGALALQIGFGAGLVFGAQVVVLP